MKQIEIEQGVTF